MNEDISELQHQLLSNDPSITKLTFTEPLSLQSTKRLSNGLTHNKTVTFLSFSGNLITGLTYIAGSFQYNTNIQTLSFCFNQLSLNDSVILCKIPGFSNTITSFSIIGNPLPPHSIEVLSESLELNSTLIVLSLSRNNIDATGIQHICQSLHHHHCLRALDLGGNDIQDGIKDIAHLLLHTKTLQTLFLGYNCITSTGVEQLSRSLLENTTLEILFLGYNNIDTRGIIKFSACLLHNESLTEVYIMGNPIGKEGLYYFKKSVMQNTSLTFVLLDEDGDDSTSYFHKIQQEINLHVHWNEIGSLGDLQKIQKLPNKCRETFSILLLILYELGISQDLHWSVVGMLRVKDIVKSGHPENSKSWK